MFWGCRRAGDMPGRVLPGEEGADGLAAGGLVGDGGGLCEVVDHGPAEAAAPAAQVGGARARCVRAGALDRHLDTVHVGRQGQGAGSPAMAQGIGGELRNDEHHVIGRLS